MKTYKQLLASISMVALMGSCNVLDLEDFSAINPGIWDSEQSATLYLNAIYGDCLPSFGTNSSNSDETIGLNDLLKGTLAAGSEGTFSATTYRPIRNVNIGLEEMKTSTLAAPERDRILGQLYFLRAYQHWKLVNLYGGIPYMTTIVDPFQGTYDEIHHSRNTTAECIQYIKADLEKAIQYLPAKWDDNANGGYGRPTQTAAAAVLSRVMLFYASPQFNPEGVQSRWEDAYAVTKDAIEIADKNGHGLLDVTVNNASLANKDFNRIFLQKNNKEVIFARAYKGNVVFHGYESSTRPVDEATGANSEPSNCPSWSLVQAYPMSNGKMIDETSSGYNATYFYKNRDPRFYSTIAYNGCVYPLSGKNNRVQWMLEGLDNLDNSSYRTSTGFYCRKMIDPSVSADLVSRTATDWVEIRYAELILNLAECAAESNRSDEALTLLAQIRERAGIERGTGAFGYGLDGNEYTLIERVILERRIELSYENKRYWDLRRRNMFAEDLGPKTLKLNGWRKTGSRVVLAYKNGATAANVLKYIESNGGVENTIDKLYDVFFAVTDYVAGPRAEPVNYPQPYPITANNPSYNFFDIPVNILLRSPKLLQTAGWLDGEFDPFK